MDGLELNFQGDNDKVPTKRKPLPKTSAPLFTIPRLKKIKRDLLTELTLDSLECQHDILAPVRKSFHFAASNSCHEFTKVQAVYNPDITAKYLERRKEMKASGYPDSLLSEMFAFIQVDSLSAAEKMCREGIRCGNQQFSGLGVSHMAVHVSRHADIVTANRPKLGEKILLVVKVVKGKVKTVLCKNVGVQLEPTPNYDCHIAKPNADQAAVLAPHMLLYSTQLYLYEYGDYEIVDYPRQVLPYAIVHYTLKEAQPVLPKPVTSLPHQGQIPLTSATSATQATTKPYPPQAIPQDSGPSNEVWRGRLHVRLVAGGQIFIDVTMLSHFVPLTVSLISPIMIHHLYPEHNAQFTFFYGLSNIALKDEVEWRAHYFKSFIMRPRPNNEEHFKALVKHISDKREMPTVKLPNDVYLFLMPNCLLASQLGLVRRDDDSPVLHCVLMSKFSTNEAKRKKLLERKSIFKKFGSAASWENLFDDSDFSEEEDEVKASNKTELSRTLSSVFREQRNIHNKFAAMSIVDADINFYQCSCKKLSTAKTHHQKCRDRDVVRVLSSCKSSSHSNRKGAHSRVPESSDQRPKQKMSKKTKSMASFSPHGSSDSDSGVENGKGHSRRHKNRFSLLNSTKTVEEELSEEELTNEQMEDIIFLRKPAITTVSSLRPKLSGQSQAHTTASAISFPTSQKHSKPKPETSPFQLVQDLHKSSSEPSFSSKPKIIPIEPIEPVIIKSKPKIIPPLQPKIIPSEPVDSENKKELDKQKAEMNKPLKPESSSSNESFVPKSILKKITGGSQDSKLKVALPLTNNQHEVTIIHQETTSNNHEVVAQKVEDFGDVDMRFSMTGPVTLHPVFLSARQPPSLALSPVDTKPQQLSPNFSLGSWLAPNEIQGAPIQNSDNDLLGPSSPTSPVSPPAESPPSPLDSPISPPVDSPSPQHSPTTSVDIESPASPPQSMYLDQLRSSPIAIPTTRALHNVSPEVSFIHRQPASALPQASKSKERIDSANDMKNFLNSGFESDLDSSYEDERELSSSQDGNKHRVCCYKDLGNPSNVKSKLCKSREQASEVRFGHNSFQPCDECCNQSLSVCMHCQRVVKNHNFSCLYVECPASEFQMLKLLSSEHAEWLSPLSVINKSILHERKKSLLTSCLATRVLVADHCKQNQAWIRTIQKSAFKIKYDWAEVGRQETLSVFDLLKKKCTNRYKRDWENIDSVLSSASAVIDGLNLSLHEPSFEKVRGNNLDLVWWGTKNFPEIFIDLCHKAGLYDGADLFFQRYCPVGQYDLLTIMPCSVQNEVPHKADSSQQKNSSASNCPCEDANDVNVGFPAATCAAGVNYEDVQDKKDVNSLIGEQNEYNGDSSSLRVNYLGQDGQLIKKEVDEVSGPGERTENTSHDDLKIELSSFMSNSKHKKSSSYHGDKDQLHIQYTNKVHEDFCYNATNDHEMHTSNIKYSQDVHQKQLKYSHGMQQKGNEHEKKIELTQKHHTNITVSANPSWEQSAESSNPGNKQNTDNSDTSKKHKTGSSDPSHTHNTENSDISKKLTAGVSDPSHTHNTENSDISKKLTAGVSDPSHTHNTENSDISKKLTAGVSDPSHTHNTENSDISKKHTAGVSDPSKKHITENSDTSNRHMKDRSDSSKKHKTDNFDPCNVHITEISYPSKKHSADIANPSKKHNTDISDPSKNHSADRGNASKKHHIDSSCASKEHKADGSDPKRKHIAGISNSSKQHSADSDNPSKKHNRDRSDPSKKHTTNSSNQHDVDNSNFSKKHSADSSDPSKKLCAESSDPSKKLAKSSGSSKKHCKGSSKEHSAGSTHLNKHQSKNSTKPGKLQNKNGTHSPKHMNNQNIKDFLGSNKPDRTINYEESPLINDGIQDSQSKKLQENQQKMQITHNEIVATPRESQTLNCLYDNNDNCPFRSWKTQSKPVRAEVRLTPQSHSQTRSKLSKRELRKRRRSRRRSYEIRKLYECDTDDDSPPPCYCPKQKYQRFEWKSCIGTKRNDKENMRRDNCSQNHVSLENRLGDYETDIFSLHDSPKDYWSSSSWCTFDGPSMADKVNGEKFNESLEMVLETDLESLSDQGKQVVQRYVKIKHNIDPRECQTACEPALLNLVEDFVGTSSLGFRSDALEKHSSNMNIRGKKRCLSVDNKSNAFFFGPSVQTSSPSCESLGVKSNLIQDQYKTGFDNQFQSPMKSDLSFSSAESNICHPISDVVKRVLGVFHLSPCDPVVSNASLITKSSENTNSVSQIVSSIDLSQPVQNMGRPNVGAPEDNITLQQHEYESQHHDLTPMTMDKVQDWLTANENLLPTTAVSPTLLPSNEPSSKLLSSSSPRPHFCNEHGGRSTSDSLKPSIQMQQNSSTFYPSQNVDRLSLQCHQQKIDTSPINRPQHATCFDSSVLKQSSSLPRTCGLVVSNIDDGMLGLYPGTSSQTQVSTASSDKAIPMVSRCLATEYKTQKLPVIKLSDSFNTEVVKVDPSQLTKNSNFVGNECLSPEVENQIIEPSRSNNLIYSCSFSDISIELPTSHSLIETSMKNQEYDLNKISPVDCQLQGCNQICPNISGDDRGESFSHVQASGSAETCVNKHSMNSVKVQSLNSCPDNLVTKTGTVLCHVPAKADLIAHNVSAEITSLESHHSNDASTNVDRNIFNLLASIEPGYHQNYNCRHCTVMLRDIKKMLQMGQQTSVYLTPDIKETYFPYLERKQSDAENKESFTEEAEENQTFVNSVKAVDKKKPSNHLLKERFTKARKKSYSTDFLGGNWKKETFKRMTFNSILATDFEPVKGNSDVKSSENRSYKDNIEKPSNHPIKEYTQLVTEDTQLVPADTHIVKDATLLVKENTHLVNVDTEVIKENTLLVKEDTNKYFSKKDVVGMETHLTTGETSVNEKVKTVYIKLIENSTNEIQEIKAHYDMTDAILASCLLKYNNPVKGSVQEAVTASSSLSSDINKSSVSLHSVPSPAGSADKAKKKVWRRIIDTSTNWENIFWGLSKPCKKPHQHSSLHKHKSYKKNKEIQNHSKKVRRSAPSSDSSQGAEKHKIVSKSKPKVLPNALDLDAKKRKLTEDEGNETVAPVSETLSLRQSATHNIETKEAKSDKNNPGHRMTKAISSRHKSKNHHKHRSKSSLGPVIANKEYCAHKVNNSSETKNENKAHKEGTCFKSGMEKKHKETRCVEIEKEKPLKEGSCLKTEKETTYKETRCFKTEKEIPQKEPNCTKTEKEIPHKEPSCTKTEKEIPHKEPSCPKTVIEKPYKEPSCTKTEKEIPHKEPSCTKTEKEKPHKEPSCPKTEKEKSHKEPSCPKTEKEKSHKEPSCSKTEKEKSHKEPSCSQTEKEKSHKEPSCSKTEKEKSHKEPSCSKTEKEKSHKKPSCSQTEKEKSHKKPSCSQTEKEKSHKEPSCSKTEKEKSHKKPSCSKTDTEKSHKEPSCSKTEKEKSHKEPSISKTEKEKPNKEPSCPKTVMEKLLKEPSCPKTELDKQNKKPSCPKTDNKKPCKEPISFNTEKEKPHKEPSCPKIEKDKQHKEPNCSKTENDKPHKEPSCSITEKEKLHQESRYSKIENISHEQNTPSRISNIKSSKDISRVEPSRCSEILQFIERFTDGNSWFLAEKTDQLKEKHGHYDKKCSAGLSAESKNVQTNKISKSIAPQADEQQIKHEKMKMIESTHFKQRTDFKLLKREQKAMGCEHVSSNILDGENKKTASAGKVKQYCNVTENNEVHPESSKTKHKVTNNNTFEHTNSYSAEFTLCADSKDLTVSVGDHQANVDQRFNCALNDNMLDDGFRESCANDLQGLVPLTTAEKPGCDKTCDASGQMTQETGLDSSFRQTYCLPSSKVLLSVDAVLPLTTDQLSVLKLKEESSDMTEKDLEKWPVSEIALATAHGSAEISAIQGNKTVICKFEPDAVSEKLASSCVGEGVATLDGLTVASSSSALKIDDRVDCPALTSQMSSLNVYGQTEQGETESKMTLSFDSNMSDMQTSLTRQSSSLFLTDLNPAPTSCKLEDNSMSVAWKANEVLEPKNETLGQLISDIETNYFETSQGQGENLCKTIEEKNLAACETISGNPVPKKQCNTLDLKSSPKRKDIVTVDKSTFLCVCESTEMPWPPGEKTNVQIKQEHSKTLMNKHNESEIIGSFASSCDKGQTAHEELCTESSTGGAKHDLLHIEEMGWVAGHSYNLNACSVMASISSGSCDILEGQGIILGVDYCSDSLYSDIKENISVHSPFDNVQREEVKQISSSSHTCLIDELTLDKCSNCKMIPVDSTMPYDCYSMTRGCKMKPGDSNDQAVACFASQDPGDEQSSESNLTESGEDHRFTLNNSVPRQNEMKDCIVQYSSTDTETEEIGSISNSRGSASITSVSSSTHLITEDGRPVLVRSHRVNCKSTVNSATPLCSASGESPEEQISDFTNKSKPCPESDRITLTADLRLYADQTVNSPVSQLTEPVNKQGTLKLCKEEDFTDESISGNEKIQGEKLAATSSTESNEIILSPVDGRIPTHNNESRHNINDNFIVGYSSTDNEESRHSNDGSNLPLADVSLRPDHEQTFSSPFTEEVNKEVAFKSLEKGIIGELDPGDEQSSELNLSEIGKDHRFTLNNNVPMQIEMKDCIVQYSSTDTETEEIGSISSSRGSASITSVSSSSLKGQISDFTNESKPCPESDQTTLQADLRLLNLNGPASIEPVNKHVQFAFTGIDADITRELIPQNEQLFNEKSDELSPLESSEILSSPNDDLITINNSRSRPSKNNDCIILSSSPDTKASRSSPDINDSCSSPDTNETYSSLDAMENQPIRSSSSCDSITTTVSSSSTTSSSEDDRTLRESRRRRHDSGSHLGKRRKTRPKARKSRDSDSSSCTDYTLSDDDDDRERPDDHYSRDNHHSDHNNDRCQQYADYESFPYQKHSSHGLSSHRDRKCEQIAEDRKSRRAHPYSRPETGDKEYPTFNLPYKDLTDLMKSLTTESFKNSKLSRAAHRSSEKRFANYRFKRSSIPRGNKTEKSLVELVRPEDIPDLEKRKTLADKVENMSFVDEKAKKSLEEIVKVYPTAEKAEEVTNKESNSSCENVLKTKETAKVNTDQTPNTNENKNQNIKSIEIKVNEVKKGKQADARKDETKFKQSFIPVCDKLKGSGGTARGQSDLDRCQSDMSLEEEEDDHNILVNLRRHAETVACQNVNQVSLLNSLTKNSSDTTRVKTGNECTSSKTVTSRALENPTDFRTIHDPTIKASTCNKESLGTKNHEVMISGKLPADLLYPSSHAPYPEPFLKTLPSTQQQPLAGIVQPTCLKKQQDKKVQLNMEENQQLPHVIKSMEGLILTQQVLKESKNENSVTTHSSSVSTYKHTHRPSEASKNSKNQKQLSSNQCLQGQAPQNDLYHIHDIRGTSKGKFTSSGFKLVTDNELNNKGPDEISQMPSEVSANSSQEILERFLCTASKIIQAAKYTSKRKEQFKETHQTSPQDGAPISLGLLKDVQSSSRGESKIPNDCVTASLQHQSPEVNTSPACMLRLCPTDKALPSAHHQKESGKPRLADLMAIQKRRCLVQQETEELNKLLAIGKLIFAQKQQGEMNENVVNLKPKINKTDCCLKWKLHKITFMDKANAYKPHPDKADDNFQLISCSTDPSRDPRLRPQGTKEAPPKIKNYDKKHPRLIPLEPINTGALLSPKPCAGVEENT